MSDRSVIVSMIRCDRRDSFFVPLPYSSIDSFAFSTRSPTWQAPVGVFNGCLFLVDGSFVLFVCRRLGPRPRSSHWIFFFILSKCVGCTLFCFVILSLLYLLVFLCASSSSLFFLFLQVVYCTDDRNEKREKKGLATNEQKKRLTRNEWIGTCKKRVAASQRVSVWSLASVSRPSASLSTHLIGLIQLSARFNLLPFSNDSSCNSV